MNPYLIVILAVLIAVFVLEIVVDILNLRHIRAELPEAFTGWYDADKYAQSQRYLRVNTRFRLIERAIITPLTIVFITVGGFAWVDQLVIQLGLGPIISGLLFAGILAVGSTIVHLPFSLYQTFVIENEFGFNKTTPGTFVVDFIKGTVVTVAVGGPVFALVVWFFDSAGPQAWLYCWAAVTVLQLVITFLAPAVIMPLFNKFTPLPDGELKTAIETYAQSQKFALNGIFTMDGSRRSTKANAFFTGFGKLRRIVLFDTLIDQHPVNELVGILAHEMGHFKLGHIRRLLLLSVISSGAMFFILSLFLHREGLFTAFGFAPGHMPVYAGLFLFAFLYTPLSMILGVGANVLRRRYEFEADAYAARTHGHADSLIAGLKRLSTQNLANLTPHPLKVFLEYSHPPVSERVAALRGHDAALSHGNG